MNGTPPARLCFVKDLVEYEPREKVRFLCCIDRHRSSPGAFYGKHHYPKEAAGTPVAIVDIEHVRQAVSAEDLQVGNWVHVIGYISKVRSGLNESQTSDKDHAKIDEPKVYIQAILLWSAGHLQLDEYERALELRLAADNMGRARHTLSVKSNEKP